MHFETWSKPGLVHSHNLSTQRSKASMEYISRSYLKKRGNGVGWGGHLLSSNHQSICLQVVLV